MSQLLFDRAGRRRSPATLPGFHAGQAPRIESHEPGKCASLSVGATVFVEASPLHQSAVVVPLDHVTVAARLVAELEQEVPGRVGDPAFTVAGRPVVSRLAPSRARHHTLEERSALRPRLGLAPTLNVQHLAELERQTFDPAILLRQR